MCSVLKSEEFGPRVLVCLCFRSSIGQIEKARQWLNTNRNTSTNTNTNTNANTNTNTNANTNKNTNTYTIGLSVFLLVHEDK